MISYLVTAGHRNILQYYLTSWGHELHDRVQIMPYQALQHLRSCSAGTYIFSDIERLSPEWRRTAAGFCEALTTSGLPIRLLNHPQHSLRRYDLLRALHAREVNTFRAYRLTEGFQPYRFPVFLRTENDHAGSLTELLRNQREFDEALLALFRQDVDLRRLLVVEFCDTSDGNGEYRKYSAFIVGDRIIPRHLIFSRNWVLKVPDLLEPERLAEEREYLEKNPHEGWLRNIFRLAGIQYGRIDYGLRGGQPQVWEINTNPVVMFPPEHYHPSHIPAQEWFAGQIRQAFEALDNDVSRLDSPLFWRPSSLPIPTPWSEGHVGLKKRSRRALKRAMQRLAVRYPAFIARVLLRLLRREACAT